MPPCLHNPKLVQSCWERYGPHYVDKSNGLDGTFMPVFLSQLGLGPTILGNDRTKENTSGMTLGCAQCSLFSRNSGIFRNFWDFPGYKITILRIKKNQESVASCTINIEDWNLL